jgi:hypothetical protein
MSWRLLSSSSSVIFVQSGCTDTVISCDAVFRSVCVCIRERVSRNTVVLNYERQFENGFHALLYSYRRIQYTTVCTDCKNKDFCIGAVHNLVSSGTVSHLIPVASSVSVTMKAYRSYCETHIYITVCTSKWRQFNVYLLPCMVLGCV